MADLLITNIEGVDADGMEVMPFTKFWDLATSDDGIPTDGDVYLDISAISDTDTPDEIYDALKDSGIVFINMSKNVPDWFDGELVNIDIDNGEEEEKELEDVSAVSKALNMIDNDGDEESGENIGKIVCFTSPKGGSGKTFTSLISAKIYAQDHPNQKVAILDLDVQEPQLGITVHKIDRTINKFYADFKAGDTDFDTLKKYAVNPEGMPGNLDFYLTPRMEQPIEDPEFWETIMTNLFFNYDMVVLDCGTEYMKVPAIILAVKVADKVILTCTAALSSSVTIGQAIRRMTGETPNSIYSAEDEIGPKIHLVLTQCYDSPIISSIAENMEKEAPVVASFGIITPQINDFVFLRRYEIFDNNPEFLEGVRNIMKVSA